MVEKEIGRRIQELRKTRGFTQEQLAETINISTHYLSALERGVYNIKLALLVQILNELDCSADEIFCNVVKKSFGVKTTQLSDRLNHLSQEEQNRICEVVEILIRSAK